MTSTSTPRRRGPAAASQPTLSNDKPSSTSASALPSGGALPSITLPKGGGSIGGMGEKFSVNPATGTASLSIPIAISPARGLQPSISLSYDSGAGNGPFGLGWNLSIPSITRKTEKGIPQYQDQEESDVFLISDAEDLVPLFARDKDGKVIINNSTGRPIYHEETKGGYAIRRYSPRVEGSFTRIERWTKVIGEDQGQSHWRTITGDNITSIFGRDDNSRIFDPDHPTRERIFSWLLSETYDTKGNALIFYYKSEDSAGVNLNSPHELNRTDKTRSANRYLQAINYGNKTPNRDLATWDAFSAFDLPKDDWLFTVAFDYGEYDHAFPKLSDNHLWLSRKDPFSSYRSGFEIRTYRLCRRILMFHHFNELSRSDYVVSSTEFRYEETFALTYLTSTKHLGHVLNEAGDKYLTKALPGIDFEYSHFPSDEELARVEVKEIDPTSLENLPCGLDNWGYQFVDLDGEGLAGVLSVQGGTWFYKRNTSANNLVDGTANAKFGAEEIVTSKPSMTFQNRQVHFADIQGNGRLDLVRTDKSVWGFYSRDIDNKNGWTQFREFRSHPNVDPMDQSFRFIDLTGDGLPDIIISEESAFIWYPSLGEDGYGEEHRVPALFDGESRGPKLVFSDSDQTIYLADMSGDGMTDILRVRNGDVCYWPNMGYGNFGAKVTMDNSPAFEEPDQFDQTRIHIADIDGSGTADIIYVGGAGIDLYLNNAGNGFSPVKRLSIFPPLDNLASIDAVDLLGNGTISVVWASAAPANATSPIKYVNLTNGKKPHLLVGKNNNLGAQVKFHYTPSTKFYLDDKEAGSPWITHLPFPVQCVEKVETFDQISKNRFCNRYAYHHGYYDSYEREFRGFGMVEQWDTEEFSVSGRNRGDAALDVPPVYTKTWFHTGAFLENDNLTQLYAHEYFGAPPPGTAAFQQYLETLLDDSYLPAGLQYLEIRESCRALKGHQLRQEIYAEDDTPKAPFPYVVSESNFTVRVLQSPEDRHLHSVVVVYPRESISYSYERNVDDPCIQQELILETNVYGDVLKKISVAYGRKAGKSSLSDSERSNQEQSYLIYTDNEMTNKLDEGEHYLLPRVYESQTYEIYGFHPDNGTKFTLSEFTHDHFEAIRSLPKIPYYQQGDSTKQRRLIAHTRTAFRSNDLSRILPFGIIESLGLVGQSYSLAFTEDLVNKIFQRRRDDGSLESLLPDLPSIAGGKDGRSGGYVDLDGDEHWWIPSSRVFFHPDVAVNAETELAEARQHFFQARRLRDPYNNNSFVKYDSYDLFPIQTEDAVGNIALSRYDYRVLQSSLVIDPNGNRSMSAFDEFGALVGSAVMGKASEHVGDSLSGFKAFITQTEIDEFFRDPKGPSALRLLADATSRTIYDTTRFARQGKPTYAATIARETHASDESKPPRLLVLFTYIDGFGRQIQIKTQAEPERGNVREAKVRWVGTGWVIYNNKGLPIREFEPFFDNSHDFVSDQKIGVSALSFYDPLGRCIASLNPNHTWRKSVFDSWHQKEYDENDTTQLNPAEDDDVGGYFRLIPDSEYLPTWFDARREGQLGQKEQMAAWKAAFCTNTPAMSHFDSLGREFVTIEDNAEHGKYTTRTTFDIQGNPLEIVDAKDRVIVRNDYDMQSTLIRQASMESGERWTFTDATGNPLRLWDSRMQLHRSEYDELRRPILSFLITDSQPEQLVQRMVYGETRPQPEHNNTRGKVIEIFDQTGLAISDKYDFKGNLVHEQRRLAANYTTTIDWSQSVSVETKAYTVTTTYDALNRPIEVTTPDHSRIRRYYNEGGLLSKIEANVRNSENTTVFVRDIEYDPKAQRTIVEHGNGVTFRYKYDPLTFRLAETTLRCDNPRPSNAPFPKTYQNTYDPVGNIVNICDTTSPSTYFRNSRIDINNDFTYDALYRLIEATGRESLGQTSPFGPDFNSRFEHPDNERALSRYLERYIYDPLGNFLTLQHQSEDPAGHSWTRKYVYNEPSLLEPGKFNNRLSQTNIGSVTQTYRYDGNAGKNGNMTSMPNLPIMRWDSLDRLQATAQQVVDDGTPEMTFYTYDSTGKRVRKVTERYAAVGDTPKRLKERIYLGDYEIYRKYSTNGHTISLERESLHIMDEDSRVAIVDTETKSEEEREPTTLIRYQFSNQVSSVVLEVDDQAQLISCEEFTPYGETSYYTSRSKIPKRYRYTGKELDTENGLYYYGARYYSSVIGRWINCDPLGITDGLNVYRYVSCNPIKNNDPTGTMEISGGSGGSNDPPAPNQPKQSERRILKIMGKKSQPPSSSITQPGTTGSSGTALQTGAPLVPTPIVPQVTTPLLVPSPSFSSSVSSIHSLGISQSSLSSSTNLGREEKQYIGLPTPSPSPTPPPSTSAPAKGKIIRLGPPVATVSTPSPSQSSPSSSGSKIISLRHIKSASLSFDEAPVQSSSSSAAGNKRRRNSSPSPVQAETGINPNKVRINQTFEYVEGRPISGLVLLAAYSKNKFGTFEEAEQWFNEGVNSWHHVFPKEPELKPYFEQAGIDIHAFGIEIPENLHQAVHWAGWNEDWLQYFQSNPNASSDQIFAKLKRMIKKYHGPGASFTDMQSDRRY